jgi:4'-phosphopantetheinyl transferase EntD
VVTGEKVVRPRLFVRGCDVSGAVQVRALHEEGRLDVIFMVVNDRAVAAGAKHAARVMVPAWPAMVAASSAHADRHALCEVASSAHAD